MGAWHVHANSKNRAKVGEKENKKIFKKIVFSPCGFFESVIDCWLYGSKSGSMVRCFEHGRPRVPPDLTDTRGQKMNLENGIDFGGVVFFGTVEHNGRKLAMVGAPIEPIGDVVTRSGNDRCGYAKIPVGTATVQVTSWARGSDEQRARVKATLAGGKVAAPKTVLVKKA